MKWWKKGVCITKSMTGLNVCVRVLHWCSRYMDTINEKWPQVENWSANITIKGERLRSRPPIIDIHIKWKYVCEGSGIDGARPSSLPTETIVIVNALWMLWSPEYPKRESSDLWFLGLENNICGENIAMRMSYPGLKENQASLWGGALILSSSWCFMLPCSVTGKITNIQWRRFTLTMKTLGLPSQW